MILKFMVGDLDIQEGWDGFIAQIQEMGAQEIIDITQAAYDRYIGV